MTLTEDRPIFQQIAEQLEEAILSGAYPEESQVPSITEYSVPVSYTHLTLPTKWSV